MAIIWPPLIHMTSVTYCEKDFGQDFCVAGNPAKSVMDLQRHSMICSPLPSTRSGKIRREC